MLKRAPRNHIDIDRNVYLRIGFAGEKLEPAVIGNRQHPLRQLKFQRFAPGARRQIDRQETEEDAAGKRPGQEERTLPAPAQAPQHPAPRLGRIVRLDRFDDAALDRILRTAAAELAAPHRRGIERQHRKLPKVTVPHHFPQASPVTAGPAGRLQAA